MHFESYIMTMIHREWGTYLLFLFLMFFLLGDLAFFSDSLLLESKAPDMNSSMLRSCNFLEVKMEQYVYNKCSKILNSVSLSVLK